MSEENINNPEAKDAPKTPSVDEIRAKIESEYKAKFEEEKTKILNNKDEILNEYKSFKEKYKDLGDEDIELARKLKEQAKQDKLAEYIANGNVQEATNMLMKGQREEWNKELENYENRINAVQGENKTLQEQLESLDEKNVTMQRNQYLKDLVSTDDSFKREYLGDFIELYGKRADIDTSTGKVYAKGDDGNRLVDPHTGENVMFSEYYAKQKVNHGLFWNGGNGTGIHGTGAGGDSTKKFKDMDARERNELRKELGDSKYEQFVREQRKK